MTAEETEEALKRRNEKETTEEDSLQIVLIRRRRSRQPPYFSQKEEEEEHTAELTRYFPLANWSPSSLASPPPTDFAPVGSPSSSSSCGSFMQITKGALTECVLLSSKWLVGALSLPCRIKLQHTV